MPSSTRRISANWASSSRTTPPTLTTEDDAAAGGLLEHVEHALARQQCMNRLSKPNASAASPSTARASGIRLSSCQMTRRYSARGNLDAHELLDGFGVAHGMPEGADAADALGHVDELVVVARFDELLKTAVDEADLRDRLDNGFVLHHQIEVQRLGQHRVLRSERDDGRLSHATHLPFPLPRRRLSPSRAQPWPRAPP